MQGAEKPGLGALLSRLADDAKALARAEVQVFRQKAFDRVRRARTALVLIGTAFVLAQAAMVALLVGLVLGLATVAGPIAAGAILFAATMAVAAVLALIAARMLAAQRPHPADEEATR